MGRQVPRPAPLPKYDEAADRKQPAAGQVWPVCTAFAAVWRSKRYEFKSFFGQQRNTKFTTWQFRLVQRAAPKQVPSTDAAYGLHAKKPEHAPCEPATSVNREQGTTSFTAHDFDWQHADSASTTLLAPGGVGAPTAVEGTRKQPQRRRPREKRHVRPRPQPSTNTNANHELQSSE